jgi:TolB protein
MAGFLMLVLLAAWPGMPQAMTAQEVRQLTNTPSLDVHPVFSPRGDQILFTSGSGDSIGIYLIPVDGGDPKRIPFNARGDFYTDWAPDGRSIVVDAREAGGPPDIFLYWLESGKVDRLTNEPGMDGHPSFSPAGDRIVFTSSRGGSLDIWTMNAHGGDPVRLTDDPAADFHPRWSPDGKHIVFTSRRAGDEDIWVMRADGQGQRRITSRPGTEDRACWSPDGSQIVYQWDGDLWLVGVDGGTPGRLTDFPGHEGNPAWSRDGKHIAFISDRTGNQDLWVLTLSGDRARPSR